MNATSCALCGHTDPQVRMALVEWIDPVEDQRFSAVARCPDHVACRGRVEGAGESWEVVDPLPRTARELVR